MRRHKTTRFAIIVVIFEWMLIYKSENTNELIDRLSKIDHTHLHVIYLVFFWLIVSFLFIHKVDIEAGSGERCSSLRSPEYLSKWDWEFKKMELDNGMKSSLQSQNTTRHFVATIRTIRKIRGLRCVTLETEMLSRFRTWSLEWISYNSFRYKYVLFVLFD